MVNCKNCGAPLSLDEAKCPYCGTDNQEAIEHLKKLKKLDQGYRKAQKEVKEEVRKSKQGYGPLIVLLIVLLCNLIMLPFHSASYEIADAINTSKYSKEEIEERMEEILNDREYAKLYEFFDHYDLSYSDYGDYYPVYNLCIPYVNMQRYFSDYLYSVDTYTDPLVKACDYIKDFTDELPYSIRRAENQKTKDWIDEINSEYELFLKTFVKLNDEDIASIGDLSNSELVVLVSKRLKNEE